MLKRYVFNNLNFYMKKFLVAFVVFLALPNFFAFANTDFSGVSYQEKFIYDGAGRITKEFIGNGNFIQYVYDNSGNIISRIIEKVPSKNEANAPILTEIERVSPHSSNPTPKYTFNSTKEGTINYLGSCKSDTKNAIKGNNTIIFKKLSPGIYKSCAISVTDKDGNESEKLQISEFKILEKEIATKTIKKVPIYRLYNKRTNGHLYTRGETDRDKVLAKWHDFEYTDSAPAFYASLTDDGTTPIYRLYNKRTGVHLYTRGKADRDKILAKYKDFEFTDNAPVFYASLIDDGTTPVYRLYNKKRGGHFYIAGVKNRDRILKRYKDFEYTDLEPVFWASNKLNNN